MDEYRRAHKILDKAIVDLPNRPATTIDFVFETGLIGVVAEIDGRPIVIRDPSPTAGGLVGPDSNPKLWVSDLDNDGTAEIVLEGLISPHTLGVWVYHYDSDKNTFKRLADLSGDTDIKVVRSDSKPTVFHVSNRDYSKPDKSIVERLYVWNRDKFVETGN